MDLGLKGKRAIVTGGTRGIGRAIAEALLAEGASVALCARSADGVEATLAALGSAERVVVGDAVDVSDRARVHAWVTRSAEVLGGLDLVVCNASAFTPGNTDDSWRSLLEIDVLGALRVFETALPLLEAAASQRGDASVVVIGSVSSTEAANLSAYGAMKAALVHMVKGLAREHAARRVRVNLVSPGTVYFPGGVWHNLERRAPDFFRAMMKKNPTGRMATTAEVATAALFLLSPVSGFTTGSNLIVDGALSQRVNY